MYHYFLFAAIHHLKSSPTFSVRPCSSVGRVTKDLIRRRWFDSHRGQKIFSLPRVVPCFPLLGLTPSGLFMGLSSTIIYTSELILLPSLKGFFIYLFSPTNPTLPPLPASFIIQLALRFAQAALGLILVGAVSRSSR